MSVSPEKNLKGFLTHAMDSEREKYRKYLESSGVLELITRVLKELYELESRPTDPLLYFIKAIGAVHFTTKENAAYKEEIRNLRSKMDALEKLNKDLQSEIHNIKNTS